MNKIKDIVKDCKRYTIIEVGAEHGVVSRRRVIVYAVNNKEAIKKANIIDNDVWGDYLIEKIEEL